MTQPLWVATRKGLFQLRAEHGWRIDTPSFLGDPVANVLDDARDGTVYAALTLGHFGAKLHRSADRGTSWEEVAVPSYAGLPDITKPAGPGGEAPAPEPPTLKMLWAICRALWDDPARAQWFGGGYDWPGVHSVLIDPRESRRVTVGVSCGGAWTSDDDGASWTCRATGMRADWGLGTGGSGFGARGSGFVGVQLTRN